MRPDIHPDYHPVAFRDQNTGKVFVTRSTATSRETIEIEGQEIPLINVEISSDSHPFWTGQARVMDTEGRVEKFRRRYARSNS